MAQKVISIVGKGPGAGWSPTKGNVWVINNGWVGKTPSMVIDMHDLDWTVDQIVDHYKVHLSHRMSLEEMLDKAKKSYKNYAMTKEFCRTNNVPLMSQKTYDGVPGFAFPLEKIVQKWDTDLFTSGICYALAYAIFKKATKIDIYGVNCLMEEEWSNLREAIMLWIGIAKGARIKVTVTGMDLRPLRAYDKRLYGYNIPQSPRGMLEQDTVENMVTGESIKYNIWREF